MFFFQRTQEWRTRTIEMRDEWGELRRIKLLKGTPVEMNDRELQEQLQTTVTIRRT